MTNHFEARASHKETLREFPSLTADAACKYATQAWRAKCRGIDWQFTFASWCDVWERSGMWRLRGPGRAAAPEKCYVMTRIGDVGPYAPGNVRIRTVSENTKEFREHTPHHGKGSAQLGAGKGWKFHKKVKRKPYSAAAAGRHLGMFATSEEAASAYQAEILRIRQEMAA